MIALYFLIIILVFYKFLDSREKKKVTKRKRAKFLFTLFRFIHVERKRNYFAIIIKSPIEWEIPKL